MRPADDIERLVKNTRAETSPAIDEQILSAAQTAMESAAQTQPNIWRTIMKSPITKFAAAAVIIAVLLSVTIFDNGISTAYAIEQTIEAYNSIRWLHINESETIFQETRTKEIWLGCDDQGNVTRMRLQSDNVGDPVGSLIIAGDSYYSEVWLARHNLRLVGYGDPSVLLGYDVSELDPKFLFERLFEQENRGEAIVKVDESMEKAEPIVVTVTYPLGSRSEKWKKVFYIEEDSKLVTRIDKFEWRSQGFEHVKTLEFSDYNQPIDQDMFTLDNDVPADAQIVDMSEIGVGLPQDDMTEQEVAEKATTKFFEAAINKDFTRAGQLYLGAPDFLVEQAFMGANVLKIISVGPGHRDPDPDSNAIHCSCKVLTEIGGQYYELNAWMVRVIRIDKDTNRWLICGIATSARPAPGIITLSRDGADPSSVTYNELQPNEFMQRWLILDPIRVEERKYVHAVRPSEKFQKDEFDINQVDVSNFQAKVDVSGQDHEWLVLDNKYGIIDLTDEFGEESLITYAWAQIDMPEERHGILGIGSDDGVKVWLNGELVHEFWTIRGVGYDNDHVGVTFKKGLNQLVIKIQNTGGPWGFCCRLMNYVSSNPKTLTLSSDDVDLSAATYDELVPSEFMKKWLVLGWLPYPIRDDIWFASEEGQQVAFDTDTIDFVNFTPQVTFDNGDREVSIEWSILESTSDIVDLTELDKSPNAFQIAYLWSQIEMPEDREAVLGVGSDDGVKVWLNGELVHENWLYRGVVPDNDPVPVTFKKGANQLVLKVQNALGTWGFCCRLLDE